MQVCAGRQFHLPEKWSQLWKHVDYKDPDEPIAQLVYEGARLDHLKQIINTTAEARATFVVNAAVNAFRPMKSLCKTSSRQSGHSSQQGPRTAIRQQQIATQQSPQVTCKHRCWCTAIRQQQIATQQSPQASCKHRCWCTGTLAA